MKLDENKYLFKLKLVLQLIFNSRFRDSVGGGYEKEL